MNPFKKFKHYIIGDALAQTDDVFERARIELMFSYTVFLTLMAIMFTSNVIALNIRWQIFLTTCFALPSLISILIILKKTKNVNYAGYMFVFMQVVMHLVNGYMSKFEPRMDNNIWSLMTLVLIFFVLGKGWGLGMTFFIIFLYCVGVINTMLQNKFLNYEIPQDQILPDNYLTSLIPLAIIIYGLVQILNTRGAAEKQIREQKILLEKNNIELEQQKRDITSSITYAKRIQLAVLPIEENIYRSIPLSFIYYKPRDIVSGDFYWFHEIDRDNYILVCADCTGHGIPGALMTVIGSNLLNQVVIDNKITEPSQILFVLDNLINITLKQQKEHEHYVQDGMDLALLKVDKKKREFIFSGAKRSFIFVQNKQMQEFRGSKFTLGGMISGCKTFDEIKMPYGEDDTIYLFTDGVTDQFGGAKNKKFTIKRFRELISGMYMLKMNEQKQILDNTMNNWIGKNEQTDDISVMGIRF